jgi:hypothetical protein
MVASPPKKVVLMNHTDMLGHHFGCARVMRLIEDGLEARGCKIIGRIDGKLDWRSDASCLQLLSHCDLIVINGEGTLHHGRKKAGWLMETTVHQATRGKEVALINALYQENPTDWAPLLQGFRHLYARDSRSAAAMSAQADRTVTWMGDLSTSAGSISEEYPRTGILVSDCVRNSATRSLALLAERLNRTEPTTLHPLTKFFREDNPYQPTLRRLLRRWNVKFRKTLMERRFPTLIYLQSEGAFIDALRRSRLCVTGRFHGVCLNLVTGTPFVAVTSNSWKIEALFTDVGLDPRRMIPHERLTDELVLGTDWSFSKEERRNIASFLEMTQTSAGHMFDALAA